MDGYIYLMCDSGHDNLFKIGMTRGNIEKRIKQLQTGNGSEIFMMNYFKTKYPFYVEKILHKKYNGNKKKGEWFELNTDSVINFIEECKFYEDLAETIKDNPFIKKIK